MVSFFAGAVCSLAEAEAPRAAGEGDGDCVFILPDLLGEGWGEVLEGEMSGTFISLSEGESLVKVLCRTGPGGRTGSPPFSGEGEDSEWEDSGRVKVLDLD